MSVKAGEDHLSAFAAGQWDHIRSGWELQEYEDRQRLKAERTAALAGIAEVYGDSADARTRRADLVASWQRPAEERPRRAWRGWWLPEEV